MARSITAISLNLEAVSALLSTGADVCIDNDRLVLLRAEVFEHGVRLPAASVEVCGRAAIVALRDALNAAYPPTR